MNSANQPGPLATSCGARSHQRGTAMPIVVVGLLAIIAMAGLAIDSSHAFVNKARLQNMVDAAALTAAKVYDQTSDIILATAAAHSMFGLNTNGSGNFEIDSEYDSGNISVVVQWSETLNPFAPSGIGPYVRVITSGFDMSTGLIAVVGINTIGIGASAVAGPSPSIDSACNIAPILVCADNIDQEYYGFTKDRLMVLKPSPGDHSDIGPGNYKLLRLECPGGDCIRDAMAGNYDACATLGETVDTEPGVVAGPTKQGFNTRFGFWEGPISSDEYPPDVVTHEVTPPLETFVDTGNGNDVLYWGEVDHVVINAGHIPGYNYDEYVYRTMTPGMHDFPTWGNPAGVPWRRVMAMPVADCSGDEAGQSTITVEGFACYYMLQRVGAGVDPLTDDGSLKNIFGQFVDGCLTGGAPGPDPGAGVGPYLIQLYKDPDSADS